MLKREITNIGIIKHITYIRVKQFTQSFIIKNVANTEADMIATANIEVK